MSDNTASPAQIQRLRERGAVIVDIRETDEFRREHIDGAISLPLTEIQAGRQLETASTRYPVIFHCQAGTRTKQNADVLARMVKPTEFMIMDGGINAWKQAGLPTVQDKKQTLPLMRQVQITAGSLILAGVIAGYGVNPGFFLLSGFIGSGLIFAGVSGWCGMANLLVKMPWNRQ
ncbi:MULTISPECIES: rhodanese family protein [Pectobacteriaceae]|uniref:DUF2892 domain-containing protein n=1 Tax=Affinibrenneria salicis TaxID=2590031 RepID=A0A5J5FRN0_9GAMM|nr:MULTISPECIES: rhodanese family protein [Pectobacteriaceae]MEE3644434.1 rhodanese family protein [Brenneria sp. L3_3C_1]MEE3651996.1 rhodanese family protein [Brenneria sp. HEZEL_4_2_4]KAA8995884.1 DUF2892 domain-containing protein [Affinibrenneria salicis]MBJ7223192.1 rhodanese family protein [Brenneria sp. L3-3C-1]MDX5628596.1 rhodanese family protein [Brenneria sp. L3-3Z]